MQKKILLVGQCGQVAWELQRSLASLGQVITVSRNTDIVLDLEDNDSIVAVVEQVKPDVIVNAGAYTAVDKAEQDSLRAEQVNAIAPGILAEQAKKYQSLLLHYSTDYVFDGKSRSPYTEEHAVSPQSVYGASKQQGEQAISAVDDNYIILRTSWVYGLRGNNFLLTMLRLMQQREQLSIVNDQWGAPTWSRAIAECSTQLLTQLLAIDNKISECKGIYHLSAAGEVTWFGFAEKIRAYYQDIAAGNLKELLLQQLTPITTDQYPTLAQRPAYSVLSNTKLQSKFMLQMLPWDIALQQCMAELQLIIQPVLQNLIAKR